MKPFDLDKAIATWRHSLHLNRSFLREDLDELENHLRDHIDAQVEQGSNQKEAFDKAVKRLGNHSELTSEYKKVRYGRSKRNRSILKESTWQSAMLKNHLTIAIRNLRRHPFFSGLNIFGLAIGLASCLLILLYVSYERSFDQHHERADHIYRLNWDYNWNETEGISSGTPPPLAKAMVEEIPEVELATRVYRAPEMITRYEDIFFNETHIFAADPNFFEVFSFPLLEGNPATALRQPGSVILTKETALKYFGTAPALGKTIEIGESQDAFGGMYNNTFRVTGVLEDLPPNSHLDFDVLTSMPSFPIVEYFDWSWIWMQVTTYAIVHDPASVSEIEARLKVLVEQYAPASFQRVGFSYDELMQRGGQWDFVLQPLDDIYLGSQGIGNRLGPLGNNTYLYILLIVALFILTIACINFMNLSTARSATRAKEVGVRKVLGSKRKNLIGLFITEAVLLTTIAMIVAIVLTVIFLIPFSRFAGIQLDASALSSGLWLLLPATLLIGLLTGSYPSLYLSRFAPITAMKKGKATGKRGHVFRNGLVVFQFAVSIALIVCTLLVNKQMRFFEQVDMGFEKDGLLVISNENNRLGNQATSFADVLNTKATISSTALTTGIPFSGGFQDYYKVEGRGEEQFDLISYMVDDDFMATMGLDIALGQGFSEEFPSSRRGVVLNESAVARFGLEDPIGKTITYPSTSIGTYEIIGVVKDFNFMSLHQSIMPFALFHLESESYNIPNAYIVARIQMGNAQQTLSEIRKAWHSFAPDAPFEYSFLDENLAAQYRSEQLLQTIFFIFSTLAILIACIGLVGLAAFAAEKRTREIGIRKSLGASVPGLLILLVKDFVKWVLIANLVAWPLAWFSMNWWFAGFAYSTDMGYAAFLIASGIALLISVITVGYHASKVALTNPIQSLRFE